MSEGKIDERQLKFRNLLLALGHLEFSIIKTSEELNDMHRDRENVISELRELETAIQHSEIPEEPPD